ILSAMVAQLTVKRNRIQVHSNVAMLSEAKKQTKMDAAKCPPKAAIPKAQNSLRMSRNSTQIAQITARIALSHSRVNSQSPLSIGQLS
ncbi:MAG: hypothetical protein ACRDC6_24210, partial [Shewanella sp.]